MRLLSLLLFSSCLGLYAASGGYSVIIKGPFHDALYAVAEDFDRQISVAGFSQHLPPNRGESETYYNAFDYLEDANRVRGEQIRLIRLDHDGQTTRDMSFRLPSFNRAVSLVKTPDDGYFVGGYLQNGQMLVASVAPGGTIRYTRTFGTHNLDRMERLIPLKDGGLLAVGTSISSRNSADALFQQGLGGSDISLTRFSKHGEILWSRKYGTADDDRGIGAAEAFDGSLMILGSSDSGTRRRVLLMRIDENGDTLWLKPYGSDTNCNAYDLIATGEDRFTASLSRYTAADKEQIRLVTFDMQQNVLKEKDIPTASSARVYALAARNDGGLVGVGAATDTTSGDTDALALSLSAAGILQWSREYGDTNRDLFRDARIFRDGTVVAVGETSSAASNVTDMWIVKLNDDGSLALKSQRAGSLFERLHAEFSDEIAKGKITLTRDLRIVLSHPALLFKAGVYELTPVQKLFLERFSKRLLAVLQPYKTEIEALRINGHTSSEWRGADFNERYLNNTELSTRRAFSVLSHIFREPSNAKYRTWLTRILSNDGYSYSKIVKNPEEDRIASRRVAFEIVVE